MQSKEKTYRLKALEQENRSFQKFVETNLLKKPESVYSPIKWQNSSAKLDAVKT